MSEKKAGQAKPKKSQQRGWKTTLRISPLAAVLAAATLIGGFAALLTLLPRVTITTSDPVDANDPFSASVTITNTGYIPLRSVVPDLSFNKIIWLNEYGNPVTLLGDIGTQHFRRDSWKPRDLGLDDRFTIPLNDMFGARNNLVSAQLAVVVEYELPIIHIHREKRFPLTAKRQTNGSFYWYADTLSEASKTSN